MTDFSDIHLILKQISENQAKSQSDFAIQRAETEKQLAESRAKTDAQLAESQAKTDAQFAESRAKTDAQLAESRAKIDAQLAESQAKTDEAFRNLIAQHAIIERQLAESQAKTDAQLARTDARMDKMIEQQNRIHKEIGGIANSMGTTAEEFFYYSLEENRRLGNIQFDEIELNLRRKTKQVQDEFDIVLYNGNAVGIVEVKYKVNIEDLDNLVSKKVEHFRFFFPDYKDHQIYLGIGGYSIPDSVAQKAKDFGVAVLREKGEVIEITGDKLKAY